MSEELFYYTELIKNYNNMINSYNSLVLDYQRIIETNENFIQNSKNKIPHIESDNMMFATSILEYKQKISTIQQYILVLNQHFGLTTNP
jgi:hypothetical protein